MQLAPRHHARGAFVVYGQGITLRPDGGGPLAIKLEAIAVVD